MIKEVLAVVSVKGTKPIYRFTLVEEENGIRVVRAVITNYERIQRGILATKVIFRYRDEKTHNLRDIEESKMDTMLHNVVYSYKDNISKALLVMKKRTEAEMEKARAEYEHKSLILTGLKGLKESAKEIKSLGTATDIAYHNYD